MVLLPCSDCCGCDCPNAPGACFALTLAGFAGDAEGCGECSYLDGTYVLKREPLNAPTATATITAATGTGAVLAVTLTKSEAQGYYTIQSVAVTAGGTGYPEEVTVNHALSGLVVDCDGDPQLEATVDGGSVASVSVVKGGRFFPSPLCEWVWLGCPACPDNQAVFATSHAGLEVRFILDEESATLRVTLGQVATNYYSGVRSFSPGTVLYEAAVDLPAEPWEELTFEAADASVTCETTGTATVSPASCLSDYGCGECCLPDQISVTTRGWGAALGWSSQNGGSPGMSTCGEDGPAGGWGNVFCGECGEGTPEDGCRVRFVGSASGPASYSVFQLGSNETGILDRVHPGTYQPWKPGDPCAPIMYLGPMPSMPIAGGTPTVNVDCGGYPSSVMVLISHQDLSTAVSISAPTKDPAGTTATAEVSKLDGTTRGITNVTVTDSGSGYAVEIMERVEPDISLAISTTAGTGATITATLEEGTDWNGDKVWSVDSLSITNGGTGYGPDDYVSVSPASGSLGWGAWASITIDRAEPAALTATAPGGSGAVLAPVLTKGTDYYGQDYWTVASVTVTNGGSGYTDGDPITFSGSFERYAASATITVDAGEITSVNVTYGGEYFDTDGIIQTVTILDPGSMYKLQGTGQVDADTPSVGFTSAIGTGATATAEVDDDLSSSTFGRILAVNVTAAGEDYYLGGKGWKAQVEGAYGMIHRDLCLIHASSFGGPCDDADEAEAFGCSSMISAVTHISNRVTAAVCPTDLLARSYPMAYQANIYPGGFDNTCGASHCLSGPYGTILTVTSWGSEDPFEIELAGA